MYYVEIVRNGLLFIVLDGRDKTWLRFFSGNKGTPVQHAKKYTSTTGCDQSQVQVL